MSSAGTPSSESPPPTLAEAASTEETITTTTSEPTPAGPRLTPAEVVASRKKKDVSKVVVFFQAIGNAPILKQKHFKITASHKFMVVIQFLRRELGYQPSDPLFLYVNSAFSPAPDEIVSNLFKCCNTKGQLVVNYCTSPAWG
ncbi:hypothetical protein MVEG_00373 [Podila verticillata NRRL 6337]|nr:hypothetical protein MVEG_00373 [Podila verticillata NRRL 6337]